MFDETGKEATPPGQGSISFLKALAIVVCAAIGFSIFLQSQIRPSTLTGKPAPKIQVEGWLNGPGPTEADLNGQVVVVDAWAYWCGPCRAEAPHLVKLYNGFKDKGVIFIGLTSHGSDADKMNREFLKTTGITWPNGFGAVETLRNLNADFIPQVWVIDRHNRIVWDYSSKAPIEKVLQQAIADRG